MSFSLSPAHLQHVSRILAAHATDLAAVLNDAVETLRGSVLVASATTTTSASGAGGGSGGGGGGGGGGGEEEEEEEESR